MVSEITLRDATQEDYQLLYVLDRDTLKEYIDRTWVGMRIGRLITFGRNSILPAGRSFIGMVSMSEPHFGMQSNPKSRSS